MVRNFWDLKLVHVIEFKQFRLYIISCLVVVQPVTCGFGDVDYGL